MSEHRKLTYSELRQVQELVARLNDGLPWDLMQGGRDRWRAVARDLDQMAYHGTSDGKPLAEPPLNDADACQRIPVMVRDDDCDPWQGPFVFLSFTDGPCGYSVKNQSGQRNSFHHARRLTPAEQAAWEAKQ